MAATETRLHDETGNDDARPTVTEITAAQQARAQNGGSAQRRNAEADVSLAPGIVAVLIAAASAVAVWAVS